jgi:predicted metal-binding protein
MALLPTLKNFKVKNGGVAQWTSHPPHEQEEIWVRIPPGFNVLMVMVMEL